MSENKQTNLLDNQTTQGHADIVITVTQSAKTSVLYSELERKFMKSLTLSGGFPPDIGVTELTHNYLPQHLSFVMRTRDKTVTAVTVHEGLSTHYRKIKKINNLN